MKIKFKRTLNPNEKNVVVYYQGKKFEVGYIKKTIEWGFYQADTPIGQTTMNAINKKIEEKNKNIRQNLLSSPLRVTFFQSKINN